MKIWVIYSVLLLLVISKIRAEIYSSNVEPWEGEEEMEEIGEEWWVEDGADEEISIRMWGDDRSGKVPVNVDSFGAVGDGIADDTQVGTGTLIIIFIGSFLHMDSEVYIVFNYL